jgi:hypothetical protein
MTSLSIGESYTRCILSKTFFSKKDITLVNITLKSWKFL